MALEPAGVSLEAQGFNQYVKRLSKIDNLQQAVFNIDSRNVTVAFDKASNATKKYEKELRKVSQSQKQFTQGLQSAATGLVAFATGAVVQFGAESAKLAAQFQGQQTGLDNLAASFGQRGSEIQAAIQTASRGAISGLRAIEIANTGLLLGVAKTPAEFEKITKIATTLGRALGLSAERSIERFTTGLGRQSKLIIDDLGISTSALDAEIERIAQRDFGRLNKSLTQAQQATVFTTAALSLGEEKIKAIGEEAGNAQAAFERLTAQSENLQVTFGTLVGPLGAGIANALSRAAKTAQQFFAFLGAGFTGIGTIATGVFNELGISVSRLGQLIKGEISFAEFREPLREFSDILDEAGLAATERFKEIASTIEGVSFDDGIVQDLKDQNTELEKAEQNLKAYENALKQAQDLQLSFAREAEDAAIKLARANEDIARKQAQSVAKLQERQAKDRDKLLKNQTKQLDSFEKDRRKQIAKAETDVQKARKEAGEQRKRDQQRLQRDLRQAQERFNLSQLQSERRFSLSERRLRAEGDILAIQQLREDRELERQEEKENFSLSKKEQIRSAKDQQREQSDDLESRVNELKSNLEEQRAELLQSFDEQLVAQQLAQVEARAEQQRGFEEAAAERAIQLQREEEDRRLSQARQLEDLGRSLADQQGVTAEGAEAIAGELEKVFGMEGVADSIFKGFKERTENDFKDLFENIEDIVGGATPATPSPLPLPAAGRTPGGIPAFGDGGIVGGPGPIGSPQIIQAHKGETVLPTQQRSFTMTAPVIPSQVLEVAMSGGFNITGDNQADEAILRAATQEMTENFKIAIGRLARRN